MCNVHCCSVFRAQYPEHWQTGRERRDGALCHAAADHGVDIARDQCDTGRIATSPVANIPCRHECASRTVVGGHSS